MRLDFSDQGGVHRPTGERCVVVPGNLRVVYMMPTFLVVAYWRRVLEG